MALINQPPVAGIIDENGNASNGLATFLNSVFVILAAVVSSGTTANRPTKVLWTGRTYFDTTLNRPIWYTGTNWIRADGTVV